MIFVESVVMSNSS